MKRVFLQFAVLLACFNSLEIFASAPESAYLVTDKSLYVSGEAIWYSGYLKNTENESSSYLIVDLIEPGGNIVATQKVALQEDKTGSGRIYLDAKYSTGVYTLRAYSSFMRNFGCDSFFHKAIMVINPLESLEFSFDSLVQEQVPELTGAEYLDIVHQKNYGRRERATIKITSGQDAFISCNVSVYQDYGRLDIPQPAVEQGKSSQLINYSAETYFPIISGQVANPASSPLELIAVGERSTLWQMAPVGENSFNAELIESSENTKFYLWDGSFDGEITINPIAQSVGKNECSIAVPRYELNLSSKELIERLIVNSQIQNIYKSHNIPSGTVRENLKDYGHFFETPSSFTYLLDDYTRFPTIKETLFEYIKGIYVRKDTNKVSQAYVFNDQTNQLFNNPALILLDGIPISYDYMLKVDPLLIEKMSINNTPFYFGGKIRDGVIGLTSFKRDFAGSRIPKYVTELDVLSVENNVSFYQPDYKGANDLSRIPDRRNTLLWTETIPVDENGQEVSFYTSDNKGQYVVKVEGIDEEGNGFVQTSTFTVE